MLFLLKEILFTSEQMQIEFLSGENKLKALLQNIHSMDMD